MAEAERGEIGRKAVNGLVETFAKSDVKERGGERVVDRRIKIIREDDMREGRGEEILIVSGHEKVKLQLGERRWKILEWLRKASMDLEVRKEAWEGIDGLVELS